MGGKLVPEFMLHRARLVTVTMVLVKFFVQRWESVVMMWMGCLMGCLTPATKSTCYGRSLLSVTFSRKSAVDGPK